LRGAAEALARRKMPLLLMVAGTPEERRTITEYITAGHVDGVLLISSHQGNPMVKSLLSNAVPTIACGVPMGYEDAVGFVSADDAGGARKMTEHLLSRGRTRIATVTGPMDTPGGTMRLRGFR